MSKRTPRAPRLPDLDIDQRLARVLDSPALAAVVPRLPPEALHHLIRRRGLDGCGEMLALATPAQLTAVLDLDLWRPDRSGRVEQFDVERFGEWLEVLTDIGEAVSARAVAALDPALVVAGLSRYVRVFDPGIFEPTAQSDDEAVSRHDAMREGDWLDFGWRGLDEPPAGRHARDDDRYARTLECEVGGYLVRARRSDAWDAIVALFVALDAEHPQAFHAVVRGCRDLSNSRPEIDGLDDLLLAPEQQLHDVALGRDQRRSSQGYATPADARAFLAMARQPRTTGDDARRDATPQVDPIVAAYFRAADDGTATTESGEFQRSAVGDAAAVDAITEVLIDAGVMPGHPRALLDAGDAEPDAPRLAALRGLMAHLGDADAHLARTRELAFLANTLVAGGAVQSRTFTPQEASDAAASICNLGLEAVANTDLITAFATGWSTLYREVSLAAADALVSAIDGLRCADEDIRRELALLRRSLVRHRAAGTPWLARGAADVLASIDMTAWVSVVGLLDECPVVPAALVAILDGRTTAVSPTAFEFIGTAAQLDQVHRFLRQLPAVLSR